MTTTPDTEPSPALRAYAEMGRRHLEREFAAGAEPKIDDLVGWEWRGINPPAVLRAVGAGRFVKGFVEGPRGAEGYVLLASQRDWSRRMFRGRVIRHSHFDVRAATGRHRGTVLLDYGSHPRNPRGHPGRLLREFLVHPDPENRDVLLGKAFVDAGRLIPVSFYLLEREQRVENG